MADRNFVLISVAQDSQGEAAAASWFDKARPSYHCVVDPTHKISTLFGWINVPSAAWIDEEGRIVRSNEGAYAGEHSINTGLASIDFGSTAFRDATRDWVLEGASSKFVSSLEELREQLIPATEATLRADAEFKLATYFKLAGDDARAEPHFAEAHRLSPDNWNFHRQAWTHEGEFYALRQWYKKTGTLRRQGGSYYRPMGLPGEPEAKVTTIDFVWTKVARSLKGLFGK